MKSGARPQTRTLLLLALLLGACDCESAGIVPSNQDGGMARCLSDDDCPDREACNVSIGVCYPLDECGPDRPCPQAAQICVEGSDGYRDCVFERCDGDDECTELSCSPELVPVCVAGGCVCGEPCSGGCPQNQGCCIPTDTCQPLPEQCMGLECPPGQFVSVTSTGAWDLGRCEFLGETCLCERLPPLREGDIGLYSALAHDGRNGMLSAYNLDYGDLMFGIVQSDNTVDWEFVDGVPSSTTSITGDVDGPRGGNSAVGVDVGIHTDIAVDRLGRPHIVYQDRDRGALKYAMQSSRGWRTHTVDGEGVGDTGMFSSLALDALNRPVVAYLSAREPLGNTRVSVLRLAFANTSTPTQRSDWRFRQIDVVDLASFGCDERCNVNEVCLDANQQCVVPSPASACSPRCGSRESCVMGTCRRTRALSPFRDLPVASGLWPSLQLPADGSALIAYHDRVLGNLKVARLDGPDFRVGAPSVRIIDGTGAPSGSTDDAGHFPSLVVTPGGEIHVTYVNTSRQALMYRNLDAALNTVIGEEVETGLDMGGGPDGLLIGADSALVVDASGIPRVAYQDATQGDLRYARRTGPNTWVIVTLAGNENPYRGSFGFYSDLVLDANRSNPVVSTYRYFLSNMGGPNNGIELFNP